MAYDEEEGLPFVVNVVVGVLPDNGVALQITYATSAQRFEAKKLDVANFAMEADLAKRLAASLLSCSDGNPGPKATRQ